MLYYYSVHVFCCDSVVIQFFLSVLLAVFSRSECLSCWNWPSQGYLSSRVGDRILSKLCWNIEKFKNCLAGSPSARFMGNFQIFRYSNTIYSKFVERRWFVDNKNQRLETKQDWKKTRKPEKSKKSPKVCVFDPLGFEKQANLIIFFEIFFSKIIFFRNFFLLFILFFYYFIQFCPLYE